MGVLCCWGWRGSREDGKEVVDTLSSSMVDTEVLREAPCRSPATMAPPASTRSPPQPSPTLQPLPSSLHPLPSSLHPPSTSPLPSATPWPPLDMDWGGLDSGLLGQKQQEHHSRPSRLSLAAPHTLHSYRSSVSCRRSSPCLATLGAAEEASTLLPTPWASVDFTRPDITHYIAGALPALGELGEELEEEGEGGEVEVDVEDEVEVLEGQVEMEHRVEEEGQLAKEQLTEEESRGRSEEAASPCSQGGSQGAGPSAPALPCPAHSPHTVSPNATPSPPSPPTSGRSAGIRSPTFHINSPTSPTSLPISPTSFTTSPTPYTDRTIYHSLRNPSNFTKRASSTTSPSPFTTPPSPLPTSPLASRPAASVVGIEAMTGLATALPSPSPRDSPATLSFL